MSKQKDAEDKSSLLARHKRHPLRYGRRSEHREFAELVIKVTSSAICGSDLHLIEGLMPEMHSVDVPGCEFMGDVGSPDRR